MLIARTAIARALAPRAREGRKVPLSVLARNVAVDEGVECGGSEA